MWSIVGGVDRSNVDSYATCFGIDPHDNASAAVASEVAFRWAVQKWRPTHSVDVMNKLAEAAGGDGALCLDFGGLWNSDAIARLCEDLSFRLAWIEEPFPPEEMHQAIGWRRPAPHAAGEHCYSRAETAILEAAGVEIWQPDAVFCGGFQSFRLLVERASEIGVRCMPHGGSLLPALHAAAAGDAVECVEYHMLLEPRRQAHLASPVMPVEGRRLVAPDAPGWAGPLNPNLRMGAVL
ncbi:MAG: enolase C-terminal domain-like protein [Nitrospira sp.]|nr:enolase C-terminal domain-like protein [Nitrospira sp.]